MKRIIDKDRQNEIISFVQSINGGTKDEGTVGIGIEDESGIIGAVLFDQFNGANVCMHVASIKKNWLTKQFLWYIFHYAFEILGVKRITGFVCSSNHHAIKFDEHIGFKLEATLKGASPNGDLLVYVMHKDQCRFIQKDFQHGKQGK